VEVTVLTYGHGSGGKTLQARGSSQTDATGEYRIFDLPAGTYFLRARPLSSQMPAMAQASESYAMIFYPNTPQPTEAAPINLAAGQEQRGLDLVLRPVSTATIRGRVVKPPGAENCVTRLEGFGDIADPDDTFVAFTSRTVFVTAAPGGGPEPPSLAAVQEMIGGRKVDESGKFEFPNIPVGSHSLTASCAVGKQEYSAKMPVQLEAAGLENVQLRPVGPSEITGQVRVEGESRSSIAGTRISLAGGGMAVGGNNAPDGTVDEKGSFTYRDLPPETYQVHVEPPLDLYVKSVTWNGRDVLEPGVDLSSGAMSAELQVLLSANGGTIEGSVENGEGVMVTLIPSDPKRAATLAKLMVAEEGGHFSFPALPPGRYKLFAWEEADPGDALYDPEFRKPFEGKGETVDIAEKQKATVQLKVIPRS
jgi:hypothetical protein